MTFHALLFCPDEKTARVTTQVLEELEFSVEASTEPFAAVKKLMGQHFDAIVVDCENEQNAGLLFKSARNSSSNQTALAVAVVEGQAGVANAFRIGANLVLTKPINVEQAKSTLRVARGLLKKGTDGAKPTVQSASAPAPASPSSAPRPVPTPVATRPSSPGSAAPRPVVAAFQSPKAGPATPVAKASVDVTSVFDVEQDPTPPPGPAEEILLESMEEHAPVIRTPQTSKPALPRKVDPANRQTIESKALSKSPARTPALVPDSRASFIRGRASATAPAPAKESRDIEKGFQTAPVFDNRPHARSAAAAAASAFPPSASQQAPSFGSLDDENADFDGGSKKRILVGVMAFLLLAAGYFGYTKFHKKTVAEAPVPVQSQPAPPASTPVPDTSSASVEPQPFAQAPQQAPAETENTSGPVKTALPKSVDQDVKAGSDTTEVADAHPATKTMVVKGAFTRAETPKEVAESSDVPAPPELGNMSGVDQNAISNIVQAATPASVPKVAPRETLKVSQGVTQGLLLKRVQPNYPRQALQMHLQGAVEMQAVIGKNGIISSVKILSGEPLLARAAAEAVLQWRYKPYLLDGEPVDIQTQITVNFKLP